MAIIRAGDSAWALSNAAGGDGMPSAAGGALLSAGSGGAASGTGPVVIPGELLVKLAPGGAAGVAGMAGVSVEMDASALGMQLWRLPSGIDAELAGRILAGNPNVEYVEPNYELSIALTPNDPSFFNTWGLHNTGQAYGFTGDGTPITGTPDDDVDAPEAWNIRTATPVVVAVIDTGIDYNHPDLAANIWRNDDEIAGNGIDDDGNGYVDDIHGYDFVNGDANPLDDHGHGTHVAGTIGAVGNNGIGVAGVAWSVELMALKFLSSSGSGSTGNAIAALNYAVANGAVISNNSWGGGSYSQALVDAIQAAGTAGHLFVAAAGNSGRDNDTSAHYPSSYLPENVIAVASTDDDDALSSFSNYGDVSVDLAAPGTNIYSTYRGGYSFLSGTSMATPHVVGAAALVWGENPSLTAQEVKEILLDTVDLLPSLAGRVLTGGRLNLQAALQAAGDDVTPPPPPPLPAVASITAAHGALAEGNAGTTAFGFTVGLGAPATGTQTLAYTVAGSGGAPANATDFGGALPSGTVTFLNGETSRTISVPVSGDGTVEANETFTVQISNPSAGLQIGTGTASNTILNDDSAPSGNTITGTNSANTLNGTSGNDTIYGLNGNDRLNGLAGQDWLDGGNGNDTMTGGQGDDRYIVASSGDRAIELSNEGTDTVQASVTHTLGSNVEVLILTGTGAINGTGNSGANRLIGNAAANTLNGSSGTDTMEGGAGNDIYVVDNAGDVVIEQDGAGTDLVQSSIAFTLGDFVEQLTLTGSSGIGGTGNAGANLITGNTGANALAGAGGNDTLVGGNGHDSLNGGEGSDSLYGGNGRDTLTGGNGVNSFTFRATGESPRGSNRDMLSDYAADDVIDLSAIDARTNQSGNQAFSFIGTSAFSGTSGQLRFDLTAIPGSALVQGDTNGDRTADIEIEVRGFTALTAADFLL